MNALLTFFAESKSKGIASMSRTEEVRRSLFFLYGCKWIATKAMDVTTDVS